MQDNITNGLMYMDSPKRYPESLKNETLKNVTVSRSSPQSLVKKNPMKYYTKWVGFKLTMLSVYKLLQKILLFPMKLNQ